MFACLLSSHRGNFSQLSSLEQFTVSLPTARSMTSVATCSSSHMLYCVMMFIVHRVYPDGKRIPVNRNNMLLRGCVLRNTEAVIGIVAYAGMSVSVCLCVCVSITPL